MNIEKLLILSPHTDDAELGAGGTIHKFLKNGVEIKWIVFSKCEASLQGMPKETLHKEFLNVMKLLKIKNHSFKVYDFPVRIFDRYRQEILEILVKEKINFKPDLVIGPSLNDFHQDHHVISNEMFRAFKNTSSILGYDLPWNNINTSSTYFEILSEDNINFKEKMLSCYKSQLKKKRSYFNNNFIRKFAELNGFLVNKKYAESFNVLKLISE
tara:strand:- start:5032 stop:5670 length:639 start_codon:yes stop_codon:yes gene_type:complete